MLEPSLIAEKKFNKETERLIGQAQLQRYGTFLENYHKKLNSFKKKLQNDRNVKIKPISLEFQPKENIKLLQLIHSDNKILTKIFVSLLSVCQEINLLTDEAQEFYEHFILYEEEQGKAINKFSKLLETLQKVSFFINRAHQVIVLVLRQLSGILGKGFYTGSATCSFPEPLDCLSELLVCLAVFDTLLNRPIIKEHCGLYRRSLRYMMSSPGDYEMTMENLQCLFRKVNDIENMLLSGNILQHVMEKCLEESLITSIKGCSLASEFLLYTQQLLNDLEKDEDGITYTQFFLQANTLVAFQTILFGSMDKRILKRLMDINKKTTVCTIYGNVLWYPEKFLTTHLSTTDKIDVKMFQTCRLNQINIRCQNLLKDTNLIYLHAYNWMVDINSLTKVNMSQLQVHHLNEACNLLIDGVKMSKKFCELLKWITNLHADEGKPMSKSVLVVLCKLIEILKSFQFIFTNHQLPLTYILLMIMQHLNHKALSILINIKKGLKTDKAYKEQHLDVLSALVVAEHALNGPNTKERILLTKLALSASGLSNDVLQEIRSTITKLEVITNIGYLMARLCDCSFLYWHQVLLPVYFGKLIETRCDLSRTYLLLKALSDSTNINKSFSLTKRNLVKQELINPLTQQVETHLRLQTHLHLQLPPSDPFQNPPPFSFKKIFPGLLDKKYLDIKSEVEHDLGTTFYNLTTVAQHDWKTYVEMRRLAYLQYGLEAVESNLPMQTLEQGLDVLEIMRNINIFVSRYLYNLNNQVFVEEWSNNKHLNTINISHVANSIRTHGIGIMNTTVNFTYQFLQNQFFVFSQFMFDELIKSRLLKDIRFFTEHKSELNQMYPFERAEKFNIGIKKLGLNEEGLSPLDLFRKLITQIGNAMGYIRLIRSGGRRCLSDATCFIPDLKSVDEFNNTLENTPFNENTKKSACHLTRDVKILAENFEEATEYFQLLVTVFASVFRNPRNIHLRNFYVIVPPLTINFIEHSLGSKERLNKKNREGAAFTDDGFAMGLAYILELLDQTNQLKTLHWFESVKAKILNDRKNLKQQWDLASKDDQKLQQTLSLTEKRVNSYDAEFQLLYYNLSSAKIFFES
ncbi:WASH complex subunit 4 [Onthophagus taurus]|uniref:WASH complex subunit 4 n=1 Tax=Onthophagus taurus TaxID=166361 RepID=UPI000C20104A|nr:WASH complex subunit 4 [Onthophagus taurus]